MAEDLKTIKPRATALQLDIIECLVNDMTAEETAQQCNCSIETVKRTKKIPDLMDVYFRQCASKIQDLVPLAVKRLGTIIKDDNAQASVHIAAVREILDRANLQQFLEEKQTDITITVKYE